MHGLHEDHRHARRDRAVHDPAAIAAFALLGSSRHLVVGADSAAAAILYAGLVGLAQPGTDQWLQLASTAALGTAGLLVLPRVFRLGFLANFLSRTVLVGFLSGVGVSLLVGELPDMPGLPAGPRSFVAHLLDTVRELPATHLPTLVVALGVLLVILLVERFAPRLPSALLAAVLAILAAWMLHLDQYGVAVVGSVPPGLPTFRVPLAAFSEVVPLIGMSASMFLVILAQTAATARSFAQQYNEPSTRTATWWRSGSPMPWLGCPARLWSTAARRRRPWWPRRVVARS